MAIGNVNSEINKFTEGIEKYDKENEELLGKIKKLEKNISQELNNKEIMLMRLPKKDSEVDFLQIQYNDMVNGTDIKTIEEKKQPDKKEESGFFSSSKNKMKALKDKAMDKIKKVILLNDKNKKEKKDK